MEFKHINDVKKYFETATSMEDLRNKFEDIPSGFGSFCIIAIQQTNEDNDEQLAEVSVDIDNDYYDRNLDDIETYRFNITFTQKPQWVVSAFAYDEDNNLIEGQMSDFSVFGDEPTKEESINFVKNIKTLQQLQKEFNFGDDVRIKTKSYTIEVEKVYEVYNEVGEMEETMNVGSVYSKTFEVVDLIDDRNSKLEKKIIELKDACLQWILNVSSLKITYDDGTKSSGQCAATDRQIEKILDISEELRGIYNEK